MKKLAILLAGLLTLSATALANPYWSASDYSGTMYIHGCRYSVSLRAKPSTSSTALMQIPRGAEVWCEPYSRQFARVYYNGTWGYVLTDYLDVELEGDTWNYWWVVNCNEWVSLRAKPNTSASVLARVPLGARVLADGGATYNGFRQVEYNGLSGYILASYLSRY